jgi:SAM-dependent methyltransferase
MSLEPALHKPNAADVYEQTLVPAIFERYARDLVDRARPVGPSDRILDLGCGTGIVARVLRERLGGAAKIVGLDKSPLMLEKARSIAPELDWREGNAMELPFAAASFDLVLCQEMLQFAPDRTAVLREVRRVLSPGGRFLASTWRPRVEQPLFDALGQIAERHLGKSNDGRWLLDGVALGQALTEAGFTDVDVATVAMTDWFRELPVRLNVMAANFDLSALSEAEREQRLAAIEAESSEAGRRFALDGGFGATSVANVAKAIAPRTA